MHSIEWWHCLWPWVHMFITHRPTSTLQLHYFDLFGTCRTSSLCTVAWQLARFHFQLTRRIAQSLGDSGASCLRGSAMWSFSLVMSECSLGGRGQGHLSNFYIVDLENFATASRWYTGDIHNSPVVGLFMTPVWQWQRLDRITVECTCLLHSCPL